MRRVALLTACFAVACGDGNAPIEPGIAAPGGRFANLAPGIVQSVVGSPIRWTAGEPFILTVTANKHADGTVSGRFHVDAKSLNARVDVAVTCLSVEGNRGWVGGIVEKSNHPGVPVGLASFFYVIDVGEGAIGAIQEDIVSALALNRDAGSELTFCNERPTTLASRRIEDGNVQVRE